MESYENIIKLSGKRESLLKNNLQELLNRNAPNIEQLIAMHYELGLSLQTLEKMNVDTEPLQVREYSRTMFELTVLKKIEMYHVSNTLISDGFRTHSIFYFVFEYVLLHDDFGLLNQLISHLAGEDFTEIMPLLESRDQLPNQLVRFLKKEQVDLSNCKLTESQQLIPDYLRIPTEDLICTLHQQRYCFEWYNWNTLTDTGKMVIEVVVKNFPQDNICIIAAIYGAPHQMLQELVKYH